MIKERRKVIKRLLTSVVALVGLSFTSKAKITSRGVGEVGSLTTFQALPLYSGHLIHGDLVYISGKGAHVAPFEIKSHTEIVLKEIEEELIKAGSSMEKVLKVSVFLEDIADYQGMNEVYKGRFGKKPPVRTTVSVAKGGVPGNSLVEMDCIAYI